MRNCLLLPLALLLLSACSKHIYPDRSQFLKDGELPPMVDLSYYKSVQLRAGQDSSLALAVAISGGGSRAANFGLGIMLGLEQFEGNGYRDLLKEVDYLSTVSGGGFAGGAYISALYEHKRQGHKAPFSLSYHLASHIKSELAYSYTGALLRANFNPRLWFSHLDDGDALERAIDDEVLGYKRRRRDLGNRARSIVLGDLFLPVTASDRPSYPMHIANSTTVQTMMLFPFTPDVLERYEITGYTHRMSRVDNEGRAAFRAPLSVGIKASGSFPVLISNSTLKSSYSPERPYLHLFDGAVTDNIGYYTAMQVLKQEAASHKVLLIIDADAIGNRYTFSKKEGALFSLRIAAQLPSSGLDARRATLLRDVVDACSPHRIQPVFFSFNALLENNYASLPEKIEVAAEQERLLGLLRSGQDISDADKQILYELLTHIGTKYNIKAVEQELLLLGGQLIVRLQRKRLLKVLR